MTQHTYASKFVSEQEREHWEEKKLLEFESLDFQNDIIPILKECYNIASKDTEISIPYSDVILKNINLITSKEPMSITYKQWKSFMAYHKWNCKKEIQQNNLHKLGL